MAIRARIRREDRAADFRRRVRTAIRRHGASRSTIARLVLRDTVLIVVVGLLVGGLSMIRGAALLRSLLFGVTSLDATSFGLAAAVLLAVAVIVPIRPVLRATRLDARLLRDA